MDWILFITIKNQNNKIFENNMGRISEILRGPEIGSESWEKEKQEKDGKHERYKELEDEISIIRDSLGRAKTKARKEELGKRLLKKDMELHEAMDDITRDTAKDKLRNAVGEIDKKVDNTKLRIKEIKEKYKG